MDNVINVTDINFNCIKFYFNIHDYWIFSAFVFNSFHFYRHYNLNLNYNLNLFSEVQCSSSRNWKRQSLPYLLKLYEINVLIIEL